MGAKKENKTVPVGKLALYERLVATIPGLERKGAAMPYTSWNGHMFSFMDSTGVVGIRLPREAREQFLEKYNTALCEAHGVVLKEYAAVPEDLLGRTEELKGSFEISCAYVKTLKPKPQKKAGPTDNKLD